MKVSPPSIIATMINLALKVGKLGTEENIYPLRGPPYDMDPTHLMLPERKNM